MCIQELDLEIKHKPGKHNTNYNADALSRNPTENTAQDRKQIAVSCAVSTEQADDPAKCGNTNHVWVETAESLCDGIALTENARSVPISIERWKLSATIDYLEKKELPGEEKVAKKLVLESQIYEMV